MTFDNWLMSDAALNLETQLPLSLSEQRSFQSTKLYCHTLQFNLRGCRRFWSSEKPNAQGAKFADEEDTRWLITGHMSQVEIWTYPFSPHRQKLILLLSWLSVVEGATTVLYCNVSVSQLHAIFQMVNIFVQNFHGLYRFLPKNHKSILHLVCWRWHKHDRTAINCTSRKI